MSKRNGIEGEGFAAMMFVVIAFILLVGDLEPATSTPRSIGRWIWRVLVFGAAGYGIYRFIGGPG